MLEIIEVSVETTDLLDILRTDQLEAAVSFTAALLLLFDIILASGKAGLETKNNYHKLVALKWSFKSITDLCLTTFSF